jgi:hypothetical protein
MKKNRYLAKCITFALMNNEQLKDIRGRVEALGRYL